MNKISAFILLFLIVLPFVLADPRGWSNDVRITFAPEGSGLPSIAIDSDGNNHVGSDVDLFVPQFSRDLSPSMALL